MLLKRLQMKKEELFAFAELLSENNPEEKTSSLLNIIGEQSKENLFTALAAYQKKEKSKLDTIRRIYPNLSPSELNICRLILQDKTVSQICELLHRSSQNICRHLATRLYIEPYLHIIVHNCTSFQIIVFVALLSEPEDNSYFLQIHTQDISP